MSKQKATPHSKLYAILLASSMAIPLLLSVLFYYGPSPINGADNYIYSELAYRLETQGLKSLTGSGPLATKYILLAGIATFYKLFGPSRISSAAFEAICVLATMVALYLMGRALSDRRAGLIAATLYGMSPIVIVESSNVGDNVPMALFASLAVLFLLLAFKGGKREKLYYSISSFVAVMGLLVVVETVIVFVFLAFAFAIHSMRHKGLLRRCLPAFALGIAAGAAMIALIGLMQTGNPAYVYAVDTGWYSIGSCSTCNITLPTYIATLMPFDIFRTITATNMGGIAGRVSSLLIPSASRGAYSLRGQYYFGYFFYVAVLLSLYLAVRRPKLLYVPWLWILTGLLYLSYGTMSPFAYKPISIAYFERSLLLFWPAVPLLMGLGLSEFLHAPSRNAPGIMNKRPARYLAAAALLTLISMQSVYSVMYVNYSMKSYLYPLLDAAKFIDGLPQQARIISSSDAMLFPYATNSLNTTRLIYPIICGQIPAGSYIVVRSNATFQALCNLSIAYVPAPSPAWLSKYTLFHNYGYANYTDLVIYKSGWR